MDTSKQNILMCRKARQLQIITPRSAGDLFYIEKITPNSWAGIYVYTGTEEKQPGGNKLWFRLESGAYCAFYPRLHPDRFWLIFSQGQLWEILAKEIKGRSGVVTHFLGIETTLILLLKKFIAKNTDGLGGAGKKIFHSFEQYLLGLVMQEKYNKTWNNGEWVDE